ncbi:YopX family protein [Bacillus thuringiensis]|uniref:YopX family protein n=1 Tax=Bacillus thuringiensis TaxID=1428 RepID=UPI0015700F83|nr:YopX family protein [Bacillus thuringiensis]
MKTTKVCVWDKVQKKFFEIGSEEEQATPQYSSKDGLFFTLNGYVDENGYAYEIDVKIVQQTCLKDKDDIDIYEGDIFEDNYFDIEYDERVIKRYEVIFHKAAFMAKPIGVTSTNFPIYLVFMFANK